MYDVYLYGMVSASTVYVLDREFEFPHANEYAEIAKAMPSVGGEAVNSAIMLAKFGKSTKLDGNWLNEKNARKIYDLLKPFKINTDRLKVTKDFGTEEIVISDHKTRTVFGNYATFHRGVKQWNEAFEEDIQNAKMIGLDPYFRQEAVDVAQLCVKNQKPYTTIDCKYDSYLAQHAASVIISHELRDQAYPKMDLNEMFQNFLENCKGLVIFTFGSDELWYGRNGEKIKKFKPYKINPIDTAGAGDSFRAGIIFGLLNSWDDEAVVDFACAVSACVCLSTPHTLNAAGLEGVLKFMKENKLKR